MWLGCSGLTVCNRKLVLKQTKNKSSKICFYLTAFFTSLQWLFIIAVFILYKLSRKSAGVNHHVVFKKYFYLKNILAPYMRCTYGLIILVILVMLILYCIKKKKINTLKSIVPYIIFIIISIILEAELLVSHIQSIAIYVYLILCTLLVWCSQLIKIAVFEFYKNRI